MFYDYENLRLHYETFGSGTPILIIHGLGCDMQLMIDCMEPIFHSLSHMSYKRFYVDLPGMGESNAPADFASSDRILEALLAFIDAIIDGDFLIAGESYGGYLTRGIVAQHANRIRGVMLLCPVIKASRESRDLPHTVTHFRDENYLNTLQPKEREHFASNFIIANAYTHKRYTAALRDGMAAANTQFLDLLRPAYEFSHNVDKQIASCEFDKPSLLIAGHQDQVVGYRDLMALLPSYPRATFTILDAAGHNAQIEQSELFTALTVDWLKRVERYTK